MTVMFNKNRFKHIQAHHKKIGNIRDIDYFHALMHEQIAKDIDEIISMPDIDKNLNIVISLDQISEIFLFYQFAYSLETRGEVNNQFLCNFIAAKIVTALARYIHQEDEKYEPGEAYEIALHLLLLMACNQLAVVDLVYQGIIDNILDGSITRAITLDYGEKHPQKMFVLLCEMLSSERKQLIDWQATGIPVEPFYIDFVREALYSSDEEVLKGWLFNLCEHHLHWCERFPAIPREVSYLGYEIPSEMHLWPFEYQAVKYFRQKHGLTTPVIDHPLMKTVYANLPEPDFSQWQPPQWFTDICEQLFMANPRIEFISDMLHMARK